MAEYRQNTPSNARIFIDYRNKKNPVKFEYPVKKSPFKICFHSFLYLWILLNATVGGFIILLKMFFNFSKNPLEVTTTTIINLQPAIILLGYFTLLPLIFALLFSKNQKLLRLMPEINKKITLFPFGKHYYKKITRLNSKIFKIPIFDNTFLDYKATGEFSKYLYKVEIKEHDFKVMKRNIFNKKTKIINHDEIWYTHFYFSQIPKKGQLEIWFK